MLGEMNDELNATNEVCVNFKHKKMQVTLKRMEVYNIKITSHKLLTDATRQAATAQYIPPRTSAPI